MLRDLARTIERWTQRDGVHATAIDGLHFIRRSSVSEPEATVYEPSLCLVAQGAKRAVLGREVFRYDPSSYLVVSADLPAVGEVTRASAREPYLSLRVQLDTALAAELLATLPPDLDARPARAMAVTPIEPQLLDAVTRLVALLDEPAHRPVLLPLVLRELTYRLLVGREGARVRQIVSAEGHGRRVARALQWLRTHFAKPLRVETLARHVRMGTSTFHHQFKIVTGMSPLQYQKRLRLQEARRLLLAERIDAAEASFRVGYESPSQFSREYRRLFGSPPRRDVNALQDAAVGE